MKLQRKGTRHSHRGVIGVESAIVMIAFVIVAAALAFVVLNMGFTTSQKAKTTILTSLDEVSSSMQLAGKVTAIGCTTAGTCSDNPVLNATVFPIKITTGGNSVDLAASITTVKYLSNSVEYDDIYAGPITAAEYRSVNSALVQADAETGSEFDAFNGVSFIDTPSETTAFVYWSVRSDSNAILDQGEHAVLVIGYSAADRPVSLDNIRTEIIPATGAAFTADRQVPLITTSVVDLG